MSSDASPVPSHAGAERSASNIGLAETPARVYLSLIVPSFNEEHRLPATLDRLRDYLDGQSYSYEVLVVDDGSADGTGALVEERAAAWEALRCVRNGRNRGKGYSVRHGVEEARGKDILFSDADLSTPIEEAEALLVPIARGECDIAIASRALPESQLEERQPWWRESMGRMFNRIVQYLIVPGIVDTQCGFKAFRGDVARHLFRLQRLEGFAFDAEVLFLARKFDYRIKEVPVRWINSPDSRVSGLRHSWAMFWEVVGVWWAARMGAYDDGDTVTR